MLKFKKYNFLLINYIAAIFNFGFKGKQLKSEIDKQDYMDIDSKIGSKLQYAYFTKIMIEVNSLKSFDDIIMFFFKLAVIC